MSRTDGWDVVFEVTLEDVLARLDVVSFRLLVLPHITRSLRILHLATSKENLTEEIRLFQRPRNTIDRNTKKLRRQLDSRIVRRVLRIVPHRDGGGSLLIGRSFLPTMDDVGRGRRSEERRGGKECVSTCRYQCSPDN